MTTPSLLTATELAVLSFPDKSVELIRGRVLVREPPATRHGVIAGKLLHRVSDFVYSRELGVTCAQDTGFKIGSDPDTVRAPDVAFVASSRVKLIPESGYAELAPELVAEILSPDDRPGEVLAKVSAWLSAGTKLVWVIDPRRAEARVYRQDGSVSILARDAILEGDDVLPGFTCPLQEILT